MSGPRPQSVGIRWDNDLGIVRLCRACNEWLPSDREFFYMEQRGNRLLPRCRACRSERTRASNIALRDKRAEAVRIRRVAARPVVLGPCPCRDCGALLTWDGRRWYDRRGKHSCRQAVAA